MFAVDIVSFGRHRDPASQRYVREALYRMVRDSCGSVGVGWTDCHQEDRGDGMFVIVDPAVSVEKLLEPLVSRLRAALRQHNKMSSEMARIRLRMAIHDGYISIDDNGASGVALNHLFRLLEAPAFKKAFADESRNFALIVSERLYTEVIEFDPGLIESAAFIPTHVILKETDSRAWIWVPAPQDSRALPTVLPADRDPLDELAQKISHTLHRITDEFADLGPGETAPPLSDDRRRDLDERLAVLQALVSALTELSRPLFEVSVPVHELGWQSDAKTTNTTPEAMTTGEEHVV